MNARHVSLTALVAVALMVSGCSGTPGPAETTPGFATEEEAFAAAEETYRAYVDALNQVDLSDPETFEPVFALTTGEANANLRESFSQMHADMWAVRGPSVASLIQPRSQSGTRVELAVCLDVSAVSVTDAEGGSVVAPDRVAVQSMLVDVLVDPRVDGQSLISAFNAREGDPPCDAP